VHPNLHGAIMEATRFSLEALMVAPSHLFDNMSQGNSFVWMTEGDKTLWLRIFLAKNYYMQCSMVVVVVNA
jgi:hypothetical protein